MSEIALIKLKGKQTSEAIQEYLLTMKEGNPYGFFKIFSQLKPTISYASIRLLFWVLHEIGLIESVRYEPSERGFRRHFYRIVAGRETDTRWYNPLGELYPDTRLGSTGYAELKKKGLKPKGGRNRAYVGGPPPITLPPPPVKPPLPAKKPAKRAPTKKKLPKVLKIVMPKEKKPELETKTIIVPKSEVEQKKREGYKLVKEMDGKCIMEKTASA